MVFDKISNQLRNHGVRVFKAGKDVYTSYRFQKAEKEDRCIVIDNQFVYNVPGKIKNEQWIEPQGFKSWWKIDKVFIMKPDNTKVYLCHADYPLTFDPFHEPELEEIERAVPKITEDKDGNKLISYEPKMFKMVGARDVSIVANAIGEQGLTTYMFERSKRELIVIALAMLIAGILVGGLAMMFFAILFF